MTLASEAAAGADAIEGAVELELQPITRRIGRATRCSSNRAFAATVLKIERVYTRSAKADRIFRGDLLVYGGWNEHDRGAVGPMNMRHSGTF